MFTIKIIKKIYPKIGNNTYDSKETSQINK